jgi:hypothetical protein
MKCVIENTELSSHEETRSQFNGSKAVIKLGIDVHQDFYVVVMQVEGSNPKPPQRFTKEGFLHWAAKLKGARRRSPRCLRSMRIWFWFTARPERVGDRVLRGLPAEVG